MGAITVRVMRRRGRKFYEAWWVDPTTGRRCSRSTEATTRRDAERAAAEIERELLSGTYRRGATPWRDFVSRYLSEGAAGLRESSVREIETTIRAVDRLVRPATLEVVARRETLSKFRRDLTAEKVRRRLPNGESVEWPKSPAAVNRHLRTLGAALNWATAEGLLGATPKMPFIKNATKAKSRPIVAEEFERMLAAVDKVAPAEADDFRFLMRLIWATGLRIAEAMQLRWFEGDVALDRGRGGLWVIRFAPDGHKANRAETVPLVPEGAALIETVPEEDRVGYVAMPNRKRRRPDNVSKTIAEVGRRANVFTDEKTVDGGTIRKAASAHDLRRSFGTRWASRVSGAVLTKIMRHRSAMTTQTYYIDFATEDLAEVLFRAAPGDTSGDTRGRTASEQGSEVSDKSFAGNDFGK